MTSAVRFRDQFAAERIKLLSLRSTYLLAAFAICTSLAATVFLSGKVHLSAEGKATFDPTTAELNTGTWSTLMILAACAGAAAMTGEFSSGLIRTTTVAVPGRARILLAKAGALASVAAVVGAITEAATFTASHAILSAQGIDPPVGDATLIRDLTAVFLALPVSAVIGLAIGTLLRHPAVAPLGTFILLSVVPSLLSTDGRGIQATISNAMPYHAWEALVGQATPDGGSGMLQQPPSVIESWIWLGAWPCLALLLAGVVLRNLDL